MMRHTLPVGRWVVLALIGLGPAVHAQSLASRVSAVGTGAVNFHFAARRGVCGDGDRFLRIGKSYQGRLSSDMRSQFCPAGPVQVRVTVRDGDVERVESWAGTMRTRDGRDIGEVSAKAGADFLLGIAARGASGASNKAILPAVLADSATVWPALLAIARDSATRSRATRQDASFWLSRFAASAIAGKGHDLLDDDDEDDQDDGGKVDLKKHAVFVLSQLENHEGVPSLLEIARSNADRRVRGQALFWLGQSGDSRALVLFESLLRGQLSS